MSKLSRTFYIIKNHKVIHTKLCRQGMWFESLTFCLMFVFSMDFDCAWSRVSYITWHHISNCQRSRNHKIIVKSQKHKSFDIIGKMIWFYITFNKEPEDNYGLTRTYRLSKFVKLCGKNCINKCALSGLIQFLAIESPLKIIKNAFYFTLKALFVFEIFQFLFWVFGHVGKPLE